MEELVPSQRALDLGAGAGSLKAFGYRCSIVSIDCDKNAFDKSYDASSAGARVVALAERLPFAAGSFDLVVCHHVLEHVPDYSGALAEIGRVLKPAGRVYVAVPNGYGLCDSIYRYVFEGGDHVNRFAQRELVSAIEDGSQVHLAKRQNLYTSFAYLSRLRDLDREVIPRLPARLRRIARLPRKLTLGVQCVLYVATRLADRIARKDWALYGWALYFERANQDRVEDISPYVNVCLYCGAGREARNVFRTYKVLSRCPDCGHRGLYFPPFRNCR